VARLGTERWFRRVVESAEPDTPERLADHLRRTQCAALPTVRSKIVGSMRRVLPTTLAAVRYRFGGGSGGRAEDAEGLVRWQALWAGDSRSYALLPASGLHALTRDHTDEDDALAQLRQDPPMTNVICADRPFTISAQPAHRRGEFPLPCMLLSATDGFFGYVHTPAHFEYVLLETLVRAGDMAEWAERLRSAVEGYTGDDASLSLVALGFADFRRLRDAFRERHGTVVREYVDSAPPLDAEDGQDSLRRWQEGTWRSYRAEYEKCMPPLPEVHE
jgi:hypothetical protein